MSPTAGPEAGASSSDGSGKTPLPSVGEQFDKYTLLAKLATGGMAELFVARLGGAAGFRKNVVIKRILPHVAHDAQFTRMFLDEALTCARLTHPNVCQVFELCETQGSHFLVLEHLEGITVGDLLRRTLPSEEQLDMRLVAGIIVQACDGLHAAHEQRDDADRPAGLVHRDVSPGNLFVTIDGIIKVLDFGIAKAQWMSRKTRTGTLLGKCEYMSPEQARGGIPLDRRSDIFSLGIVFWELLCGRRLFRRNNDYETLKAVLREPIERPSEIRTMVPPALDEAIMRALERDRDDRFRTAYEFRKAVDDALKHVGGPLPLCDIAPLVRRSFAGDLAARRRVLSEADDVARDPLDQDPTVNGHKPRLRSVPPFEVEGLGTEGDDIETDLVTDKRERLPPLETEHDDDLEKSRELTVRVLPARPPTSASAALPVAATETDAVPATVDSARAATPSGRESTYLVPSAVTSRGTLFWAVVALAVLVSIAGVVLAGIYIGKSDPGHAAPHKPPTQSSLPPSATTSRPVPAASNAAAVPSEPERDAAPAGGEAAPGAAVVMTLDKAELPDATAEQGTVTIHSTLPAEIYLYPQREVIGTTPLEDYPLPAGRHKFKAMVGVGEGKMARKYFILEVEAGASTEKRLSNWQ